MTIRFAAIISHPIQHFAPLFRRLASEPNMEVRVFYCCDRGTKPYHDAGFNSTFAWDIPLLEGYEYEFLPVRRRPERLGFWQVDNPDVANQLSRFAPHAIWLHGYSHRTIWRAARWAKGRAALIHFGDSELVHQRSWWRRTLKDLLLRRHFRRCDAFITIGDNNEAYYRHYGVPDEKMFRGAYPIDLNRFQNTIDAAGHCGRGDIRRRYGFPPDGLVALHVGKLIPRKRPEHFVDALHRVVQRGVPIHGLLVGDGPMKDDIQNRIHHLGLSDIVRISGFVNQRDMPLFLHAGDLLVSTSEVDAHPLVVTESLAVGLPVIASDRIGCVGPTDTARPGVNAIVYPFGDIDTLALAICQLIQNCDLRQRMSSASRQIASTQDVSVTVQSVLKALRQIDCGSTNELEVFKSEWIPHRT